ncbi:MAG: alpha/beta hydrolase [Bacteroidota bacterium]
MRVLIFTITFFITANLAAQKRQERDTSFSTFSAYVKALKKHPGITIAEEIHSKEIKEDTGIVYCDLNGRKLVMDAFYSVNRDDANRIAIIIIHGGGWRSGSRIQHYPLAQKLAQAGYTCFTPEYRLSTEAIFPAAVHDIKAAIRWVKQNVTSFSIDTSKIAVLGFSAGGELAAFVGTTGSMEKFEGVGCNTGISSNVNAMVDIDGTLSFVHPESSEGDDSKKLSAATQWFGISKKDSFQLWQDASPLTYVNKNTPPTLFINSSVAPMHAGREAYIKVLSENGIYSEVHTFENSPHTFCLFHPWFEPTVKYIDDFLKKVFVK